MAGAEFDGWLTVGITAGDTTGSLISIGLDFDGWTASSGLSSSNGAVFWIVPDDGPNWTEVAVIAQVTVSGGFTAVVNAKGRSKRLGERLVEDWKASGITFTV